MPDDPVIVFGADEAAFRVAAFLAAFLLFSFLEASWPRRVRSQARSQRWFTNAGMLVAGTILVRALSLVAPLLAISASAALAGELRWGVFNQTDWPLWLEGVLAIVVLDLAIWAQHLVSHKVPFLWRFHRVHHSDRDLDASSALRFHPVEIALSAAYKLVIVMLLGPSILAVVLFEVILNASAMFNHANLSLPRWLDAAIRSLIVTPDMHRVHHSIHRAEHDTNFGFCLSIWDRVFRTYTAQPQGGHSGMTIGLKDFQIDRTKDLGWSLILPIRSNADSGKTRPGIK